MCQDEISARASKITFDNESDVNERKGLDEEDEDIEVKIEEVRPMEFLLQAIWVYI